MLPKQHMLFSGERRIYIQQKEALKKKSCTVMVTAPNLSPFFATIITCQTVRVNSVHIYKWQVYFCPVTGLHL